MKNQYRAIAITLLSAACAVSAVANEAIPVSKQKLTELQKIELLGTPYQVGLGKVELSPNAVKPRHMHTAPEVGYVLDGEIIFMKEGQHAETIKAGESFQMQAEVPHTTKAGPNGAIVLVTWVVKKGTSVAVPAP